MRRCERTISHPILDDSILRCLNSEIVNMRDSKSRIEEHGGSNPLQGIILRSIINKKAHIESIDSIS